MKGSALVFEEEGWLDEERALVAEAPGLEESLVAPWRAKSQQQPSGAALVVGGIHPPFGLGDGKLALLEGTQGAKGAGRVRRRT